MVKGSAPVTHFLSKAEITILHLWSTDFVPGLVLVYFPKIPVTLVLLLAFILQMSKGKLREVCDLSTPHS
jgi:hypothetical protein